MVLNDLLDQEFRFTKRDIALMETHGLRNILNVVSMNADMVRQRFTDLRPAMDRVIDQVHVILDLCSTFESSLPFWNQLSVQFKRLEATTYQSLSARVEVDLAQAREIFQQIFRENNKKMAELLQRVRQPDTWALIEGRLITQRLKALLGAVARNSQGRYRIVFQARDWEPNCYLVLFQGFRGQTLHLPSEIQGILNDLVLNSRKYAAPGSIIRLRCQQLAATTLLEVSDTGRGIPEGEIPLVVMPGYRASNVLPTESSAGGHGLSKAFWMVNNWGGTLSITSRVGQGTTIRLEIPTSPTTAGSPSLSAH